MELVPRWHGERPHSLNRISLTFHVGKIRILECIQDLQCIVNLLAVLLFGSDPIVLCLLLLEFWYLLESPVCVAATD